MTLENIIFPTNSLIMEYIIDYCVKCRTWKNVNYLHLFYTSKYFCSSTIYIWRLIIEMGVCTIFSIAVLLRKLIKLNVAECQNIVLHKSSLSTLKIDCKVERIHWYQWYVFSYSQFLKIFIFCNIHESHW